VAVTESAASGRVCRSFAVDGRGRYDDPPMSAPAQSEPPLTSSAELAGVGPAGLGPGERDVVAARYRLLEFIAEGGMGAVYKAEHVLSRKKLAIKVVHPYLCKGRQGVERFRREVSAAAEIDHPGIVQVYDAGVDDDGGFFMAMELLEGESLGDLLRRDWPGMDRAVRLVEGMLEPLTKAHATGFVHRDLKPDNIFLAKDEEGRERVKILDFGLAREVSKSGATRTGITFGTPEYMSPEQAMSARKVRPPGDVWSVGVMLYELLSGEHPFNGETPNAIMANAIKEPLPPLADKAPHVPRPLAALIERCLEKNPERRPQDAGELLTELREVLAKVALDDTVPAAPSPLPTWQESGEAGGPDSSVLPLGPARNPPLASVDIEVSGPPAPAKPRRRMPILVGGALAGLTGAAVAVYLAVQASQPPPMVARQLEPTARPESATVEPNPAAEPPAPPSPVEARDVVPTPAAPAPSPAPAVEPPPVAAVEPPAPAPTEPAPTAARPTDAPSPSVEAPEPAPERVVAARRRPRAEELSSDGTALQEARACLNRNDRACARAILEARARTAAENAHLIHIYREQGATDRMLRRMRTFIRRWPSASETPGYRAELQRYGML
jgi:serine/threonine protein kinase